MEIWIRSQNKEQLANITGLILVDNEIRGFTNHQDYYELGTYKTKERALEVLDEIQNKIENTIHIPLDINDVSKQVYTPPFMIYEMPEE